MRLAVFSDLHLDTAFRYLGNGGRERRSNLRQTLRNIIEVAHQETADALLCGGDLYEHARSGPDTRNFLVQQFDQCEFPVLISPGNHDWYGQNTLYEMADWPANVHIFKGPTFEPFTGLSEDLVIWGAAHRAPTGTDTFFDSSFKVPDGAIHLALFHGAEQGVFPFESTDKDGRPKGNHAPFRASDIEEAGFAHAFVGHFHTPRDQDNYTYPGSPDALSFAETDRQGLVIADIDETGVVTRQRHDVSVSDVLDLELDVTDAGTLSEVADRLDSLLGEAKGYARVTLKGVLSPEVDLSLDQLESHNKGIKAVLLRLGDMQPGYDLEALAEEPSVRGEFVRRVVNSDLEEAIKNDVLDAGLRALDGYSLEF